MANPSIISRHMASVSSSANSVIDFGTSVQKVYVTVLTNDVFIEFDGTADTNSFRITAVTGQPPTVFEFPGSNVRTVNLLAVTGTANVYVMGVVN